MRIILYTGKGGVGKTSVAASSAVKIAKSGKKVLILSTDRAHSLSDSFEIICQKEPTKIMDNLDGMEIDAVYESEKNWSNCKEYLKRLLTSRGEGDEIEVEELLVFPGLEELLCMIRVLEFAEEDKYDVIILDCAPTGETLSLLKYPEMLSNIMNKVLPMKKVAVKVAGPAVEKTTRIPMPEENFFDDLEHIMNQLSDLQNLMQNKNIVSVRIVTTPEQIVISEAKRNFTCMHLFDYNVDAVIVNKIYPKCALEGYFDKWDIVQEENLKRIKESFSEVPIFYMELQNDEIVGLKALEKTGDKIFGDKDVMEVMIKEKIYEINEKEHCLTVYLPFAKKDELNLGVTDNDLIISYRNETRRFAIPATWKKYTFSSAKMEGEYLNIYFL